MSVGGASPAPATGEIPQSVGPAHLVYSRRGLAPEGDVRCLIESTPAGVRVVLEQGATVYRLVPTQHVLEGVTANLQSITRAELEAGRATIGRVGYLALERLARAPRIAA